MKRFPKFLNISENAFKDRRHHGKFIIDLTPMKLCLQARFKRFKTMREAVGLAIGGGGYVSNEKAERAKKHEKTKGVPQKSETLS
jgi:hypothetical protein